MTNGAGVKIAAVAGALVVLVAGLVFALTLGGDDAAPGGDSTPTLKITPSSGPSGQRVTLEFSGGEADQDHTIFDRGATTPAQTDPGGAFTVTGYEIIGSAGVVTIEVVDRANRRVASAPFTIVDGVIESTTTSSTTTTSTIPDPAQPPEMTLTLDPASGPAGQNTETLITVTGPPGLAVTVNVPLGQSGNTLDENGVYTIKAVFNGGVGETRPVVATVGNGPKAEQTKDFSFTGAAATKTEVSVSPDKGASPATPTISISGEPSSPVALTIDGEAQVGVPDTDADGNATFTPTLIGAPRDIPIEATIGSSSGSTSFELTAAAISGGPYIFVSTFDVNSDEGGHAGPIGMPSEMELFVEEGSIIVGGPAPFVAVVGDLDPDGSFDAEGSGSVAGIPDVNVRFVGTATPDSLTGQYTMGAGGELPGGEPIVFDVASVSVTPPQATPDFEAFYQRLSDAQATGDIDFLTSTLHPAVVDRYGATNCGAYFESTLNPDATITFLEVVSRGQFVYDTDGESTVIADAYTVSLRLVFAEGEDVVETHATVDDDGTIRWFTDCGDL